MIPPYRNDMEDFFALVFYFSKFIGSSVSAKSVFILNEPMCERKHIESYRILPDPAENRHRCKALSYLCSIDIVSGAAHGRS